MSDNIMNYWQAPYNELLEKMNQFMKMNDLIENPLSRFKDFTDMFQKASGWNTMINFKDFPSFDIQSLFEHGKSFMNFDKYYEDYMVKLNEFISLIQKISPISFMLNPSEMIPKDLKKNMDEFLKMLGLVSVEEYRSLINKYDELKKQSQVLEKQNIEQSQKISELNQAASADKKKVSTREKSVEDTKKKLDEQKKISDNLGKELDSQKKQNLSLEKELSELKAMTESLKKNSPTKSKNTEKS
jgi:hypothetical protein